MQITKQLTLNNIKLAYIATANQILLFSFVSHVLYIGDVVRASKTYSNLHCVMG